MSEKSTIIIKKIKKASHGHHGGAWKVAYADFVTAMMAFFLLLWLLSISPKKVLTGIAEYFTPTVGFDQSSGAGIGGGTNPSIENGQQTIVTGSPAIIYGAPLSGDYTQAPKSKSLIDTKDNDDFSSVLKNLENSLQNDKVLSDFAKNVIIDMTPEGLRIQIVDDKQRAMFVPGTSILEPYTKKILDALSKIIKPQPNYLSIAGHTRTESKENSKEAWTLSAMRAEEVRKYLTTQNGISDNQVHKIVGFADNDPLDPKNLDNVKNIRVSITLIKSSLLGHRERAMPTNKE